MHQQLLGLPLPDLLLPDLLLLGLPLLGLPLPDLLPPGLPQLGLQPLGPPQLDLLPLGLLLPDLPLLDRLPPRLQLPLPPVHQPPLARPPLPQRWPLPVRPHQILHPSDQQSFPAWPPNLLGSQSPVLQIHKEMGSLRESCRKALAWFVRSHRSAPQVQG